MRGSILWLVALALPAQTIEVAEHTLANGLKILVHEDHAIPSVALHLFFKIGSRNERPGTTGLSHFFEHMMFNGARKYGPKQFDIQMEKNGGPTTDSPPPISRPTPTGSPRRCSS